MKDDRLSLVSKFEENLKIAKLLTEGNITRILLSAEAIETRSSVTFVGAHRCGGAQLCVPAPLKRGKLKLSFQLGWGIERISPMEINTSWLKFDPPNPPYQGELGGISCKRGH